MPGTAEGPSDAGARGSAWRARGVVAALFALGLATAFGLGAWRKAMGHAESVHFALNFPAAGPSAGGYGARGADGRLVIDLSAVQWPKRLLQPRVLNLSSHWVTNKGATPRRVRVDLVGTGLPMVTDSIEKTWDPATNTLGRALAPGEGFTLDWNIELPAEPAEHYHGSFQVRDARTGELLTTLPLAIEREAAAALAPGGDCCAP